MSHIDCALKSCDKLGIKMLNFPNIGNGATYVFCEEHANSGVMPENLLGFATSAATFKNDCEKHRDRQIEWLYQNIKHNHLRAGIGISGQLEIEQ